MTLQIGHIIFCKFSIEPLYDKVVTVVCTLHLSASHAGTGSSLTEGQWGGYDTIYGSAKTLRQTRARWRVELYSVDYTLGFLRGGRTTARGRVGAVANNYQESNILSLA